MSDDRTIRDSPWTSFFYYWWCFHSIIGLLGIILSFFIIEVPLKVFLVGARIIFPFFQVFTDIRWYIQKCADQIEGFQE